MKENRQPLREKSYAFDTLTNMSPVGFGVNDKRRPGVPEDRKEMRYSPYVA
jgi:hypothetical protein